jgi:hypothetical protein
MKITLHASRFTLLLVLLLTIGWTPAPQTDEFIVEGQVTNGTLDSAIPTDLPITLHVFSGMEETNTYTTTLAADGSFHFDGITPEGGETFAARVVYQDVTYVSEFVTLEPGQLELDLPMTIYETTEDLSVVLVTQLHIFMTREGDRLQVGEYYLISNTGDQTCVGAEDETGRRTTLTFTIPDGAEGLNFDGPGLGERYLELEEGFADTEPIPPGTATAEVLFSYDLPYREGFRVERTFDVPVTSVVLVLAEEGMALEGASLTSEDIIDTQMGPALSYTAGPLAAGEPLAFTLSARSEAMSPAPTENAPARNPAQEIAVGLAALAAAAAAIYWMWRSPGPGPLPARARRGVELIAALDADFETGRVGKKKYHKERGMLKRQLRVLLGARGYQD